ncbi:MAG TPA: trigger factor [Phycisphaerales bacterium]|nr:trigger factor [Phycisphaerales bacterium]
MSTATQSPNKVTVADAGPSRKKLTIEIPAATVTESLGFSLEAAVAQAELPGFRKGRAPRRLIEKRFGGHVQRQAKETLVGNAVQSAVQEHKLRVLGNPFAKDIDKLELTSGKPFSFEVEIEVLPEFEMPKFDGLSLRKPQMTVSDEMIENDLRTLSIQEGSLEERPSPEPGDYLTGHAKMTGSDGNIYFESDGIVVQVPPADKAPKGMIVGLVVEDLSKQLANVKVGEKVTVKTKGPEQHENEKLRGMDLTIEYTPARCDRIIPAPTADLIARFGMTDETALRQALRERQEQRVKIDQQVAMRTQLAKHLLEEVKMDLPQRLTADQIGRNMERRRLELLYRGVDAAKIEENLAELRAASTFDAVRDLKLFFILDKAAEELGVKVTENEINGRIAQMAQERNERPEKLRQQLMQSNMIGGVYNQLREHKTMDAIIAKANVTELPLDEYNKQVEAENKASAEKAKSKK